MEKKSSRKKKKKMTMTTNHPSEAAVPAAADSLLNDELIVEILSRLPVKSVHRFKCVSPSWRDLIGAHRKKLPNTLAGFIYNTYDRVDPRFYHFHFANVSVGGAAFPPVDLALPFLPDEYLYVARLDICNGLILCLAYTASPSMDENAPAESHYVVCNPATKWWVDLPPNPEVPLGGRIIARLAFDPAVPSQFHVLQFEEYDRETYMTGVNIYSSQTGAWHYRKCQLAERIYLSSGLTSVFFHGMLHLLGLLYPIKMDDDAVLVAVDMEGQVWKNVRVPPSGGLSFGEIGLSQGCLLYAITPLDAEDKKKNEVTMIAAVWCMKDYDSKEWVLKHSVTSDELPRAVRLDCKVVSVHPDHDTIFLGASTADRLASFDMQRRKYRHILNLKKKKGVLFLPYVPLYSDSLAGADGQ